MHRITGIKGLQIIPHRPCGCTCLPDRVHAFNPPITSDIAADQAAVHGEALATNQTRTPALPDDILE